MGSFISKGGNKQKCGVIEDAQKIRIDSSPLHCPVCMSVFNKAPEILPCGHSHCVDCLDKLKNYTIRANQEIGNRAIRTIECPLCRAKVPIQRHRVRNYAIEAILDSLETYNPEDDPTNDIISTLNISIKRLNMDKRELEQKVNILTAQNKLERKFTLGILTLFIFAFACFLGKLLLFNFSQ